MRDRITGRLRHTISGLGQLVTVTCERDRCDVSDRNFNFRIAIEKVNNLISFFRLSQFNIDRLSRVF